MEGILWLPVNYRPGTRVPLLTELHGGPTGVTLTASRHRVFILFRFFFSMESQSSRPTFEGLLTMGQPFV